MKQEQIETKTKELYKHLVKMARYSGGGDVDAACVTGACDIVKALIMAEAINKNTPEQQFLQEIMDETNPLPTDETTIENYYELSNEDKIALTDICYKERLSDDQDDRTTSYES